MGEEGLEAVSSAFSDLSLIPAHGHLGELLWSVPRPAPVLGTGAAGTSKHSPTSRCTRVARGDGQVKRCHAGLPALELWGPAVRAAVWGGVPWATRGIGQFLRFSGCWQGGGRIWLNDNHNPSHAGHVSNGVLSSL